MKNVIVLELRKHWKNALSLAFLFVMSLFVVTIIFRIVGGISQQDSFQLALYAITVAAVILFPSILGTTAGARLRREPERSAEETLPVSPFLKVFGAYFAGLLFLLCFVIAFASLYKAVFQPSVQDWFIVLVAAGGSVIYFHFLCFLFAYWIRLPLLAATLAALTVALQYGSAIVSLAAIEQLQLSPDMSFFTPSGYFVVIAGSFFSFFLLAYFSLLMIAKRIERGSVGRAWTVFPIFGLTLGPIFCLFVFFLLLRYSFASVR